MPGNRLIYFMVFALVLSFWFIAYKTSGQHELINLQSPFLGAGLIFLLRLSDMTLDTLRLTFVMRGHKWLAALVGFMQAAIVVVAITKVVNGPHNVWNIIGYAGGFSAGILVGMTLEEHMALGFCHLQIITRTCGDTVAGALRGAGHAATIVTGSGKDGAVSIVTCTVRRSDIGAVKALAGEADPDAFVTGEEVRPLARGYFRG